MEPQLLTSIQEHMPVLSTAVLLLLAAFVLPQLFAKNPLSKFPSFGDEIGNEEKRRNYFLQNAKKLYSEGYKKFRKQPFVVTGADTTNTLVLPARYLEELKKLPDSVLSFDESIRVSMAGDYTGIPVLGASAMIPHVIKADLTPALTAINPVISDEVDRTVREGIPSTTDWTPVNINKKLLRIIAIVSGRVFIGPELCRAEPYIEAAIDYTVELIEGVNAIKALKPWQRRFKANNLPAMRKLRQREEEVREFLAPVIDARREALANDEEVPEDMLTWLLTRGSKAGVSSTKQIAQMQLGLTFAAIHTTSVTATNIFYNMASYPEYTQPLRAELRQVLDEHDGVLTFRALQQLKKLDSFIKESMRIHPVGVASFTRRVMQDFTLSDGQFVPRGTEVTIPSHAISRDPELFPNPEKFEGFRFSDLRDTQGAAGGKHQFVSVTPESLLFGYGRHACPGRFFAANEIKMIVARVLLNYDMKNADGTSERYKNFEFGLAIVPDPTKELLMRAATD